MQHLKLNIIPFEHIDPYISISIWKEESDGAFKIHRSLFSRYFWSEFSLEFSDYKHLYVSFSVVDSADYIERVKLDDNFGLARFYCNLRIKEYFEGQEIIARINFIKNVEVWIADEALSNNNYISYKRFSFKYQFRRVSPAAELLVSFDGVSKVFRKSLADIDDIPVEKYSRVVHKTKVFKYDKLENEQKQNLELIFPLLNNEIKQFLNIPFKLGRPENKYPKYFKYINDFITTYLITDTFKEIIDIPDQDYLLTYPEDRVLNTEYKSNLLSFNGGTDVNPYNGIKNKGPKETSPHNKVIFFMIFHQEDTNVAKQLNNVMTNGIGHFRGLKNFIKQPYTTEHNGSLRFSNMDTLITDLKSFLLAKEFVEDARYVALYITPITKWDSNVQHREIYFKVKEQLLKSKITSQVMRRETIMDENFKYSLPNIAVALLAKLDGIPWRLDRQPSDELIIGIGAFSPQKAKTKYLGSAFCFTNEGKFHGFDCFTSNETSLLAHSIQTAILHYLEDHQHATRLIIHYYKDISQNEIKPITDMLRELGLDIPVVVITINKTVSEDIVGFDINSPQLMPFSGTILKVGYVEYLLFNNARYTSWGKEVKSSIPDKVKDYHFPIKLSFYSTEDDYFEDRKVVVKLIDQVYQFSRMYWKSVSQQNLPVTIKYPEMVAQIFPHFEDPKIPDFGKTNLWFL